MSLSLTDVFNETNKPVSSGLTTVTKTNYQLADISFYQKMFAIDAIQAKTFIENRLTGLQEQRDNINEEISGLKKIINLKEDTAIRAYVKTSSNGASWGMRNHVTSHFRANLNKGFRAADISHALSKSGSKSTDVAAIANALHQLCVQGILTKVERGVYMMKNTDV